MFDIFTDMYDLNVAEFVRYTDHLIAFFSFSLTLAALKVVMRVYCRSHYHIMNVSAMFCYFFCTHTRFAGFCWLEKSIGYRKNCDQFKWK